ncbi:FAD-dependent oxidoreductase [Mycobacterium uberis]|uniref:FAD-dependent oxidoreductase n=1 Tax=Mycobacterium uberis TaxID=2162698 RepID=UPI001FB213B9|nr:FAD-dependent oxidoreductase [Mycobacterium uberis]
MAFTVAHQLEIAARSGGHSYVGASTVTDTMVLDLPQLLGGINCDVTTGTGHGDTGYRFVCNALGYGRLRSGHLTDTCPSVSSTGNVPGG